MRSKVEGGGAETENSTLLETLPDKSGLRFMLNVQRPFKTSDIRFETSTKTHAKIDVAWISRLKTIFSIVMFFVLQQALPRSIYIQNPECNPTPCAHFDKMAAYFISCKQTITVLSK